MGCPGLSAPSPSMGCPVLPGAQLRSPEASLTPSLTPVFQTIWELATAPSTPLPSPATAGSDPAAGSPSGRADTPAADRGWCATESHTPARPGSWGRYLDLSEELPEAGPGIHLQALGELQDELHDDGLVRHLLHERAFLREGTDAPCQL